MYQASYKKITNKPGFVLMSAFYIGLLFCVQLDVFCIIFFFSMVQTFKVFYNFISQNFALFRKNGGASIVYDHLMDRFIPRQIM